MNDRPTYPELLKLFYKHSFPDQLGAPASSVAQAIFYKANELYFPYEFKISNVELSHLSGEDVSNIGRTRQKVLDICKIDRVPLFTYAGNDKRKAGKYIINYSLTSSWRQDSVNEASTKRQDPPLNDNDPNLTLHNITLIEKDFAQWLIKEFQNCVPGTGWRPESDNERERFNELCNAPKNKLEVILTDARLKGISTRGLLKWVEGGLANFEKFHGKKDNPKKQSPGVSPRMDMTNKEIEEAGRKSKIAGIVHFYEMYKSGELDKHPHATMSSPISVYNGFASSRGYVAGHPDDLPFSIAEFDRVTALWEGRE